MDKILGLSNVPTKYQFAEPYSSVIWSGTDFISQGHYGKDKGQSVL